MLKKDLILRQFEEFGKVLARLLTFKKESDWERFEKELREAMQKFTQLEIDHVESLSEGDFLSEVVSNPSISFGRKKILAGFLFAKLEYYKERGESQKYSNLKNKCFDIYTFLANDLTENEYDLDVHYKLNFLKKLDP